MNFDILGIIAAPLVAGSSIPQIIRCWRLKSAYEISLPFLLTLLIGLLLYAIYFAGIGAKPALIGHIASSSLVATLLVLKLKYGLRRKRYGS